MFHFAYWLIYAVLIFASINWGLIALSGNELNLARIISGGNRTVETLVYGIAGVAGAAAVLMLVAKAHPCLNKNQ